MKLKILLISFMLITSLTGFCQDWTITNSGFSFTLSTLTINSGETVRFNIESIHNVREVSQATWNANGNSHLSGGFQLPFGGGTLSASQLLVGTHYYVCEPHGSSGMKGIIIVQNITTGIDDIQLQANFSIFPNPSNGLFKIIISEKQFEENSKTVIFLKPD